MKEKMAFIGEQTYLSRYFKMCIFKRCFFIFLCLTHTNVWRKLSHHAIAGQNHLGFRICSVYTCIALPWKMCMTDKANHSGNFEQLFMTHIYMFLFDTQTIADLCVVVTHCTLIQCHHRPLTGPFPDERIFRYYNNNFLFYSVVPLLKKTILMFENI